MLAPGTTYVRRLVAAAPDRDGLAVRLRLERTLGAADLRPPGLPPQAIVCLRRVRVGGVPADAASFLAWQSAARGRIEDLARRAYRPAAGPVPGDAEAVLFLDEAELMACLALDWCAGAWWWKGLFPNVPRTEAIRTSALRSPEYVPAALRIAARHGNAVFFAQAFDAGELEELTRAVLVRFASTEVLPRLEALEAAVAASHEVLEIEERREGAGGGSARSRLGAPWAAYVPEAESPLLEPAGEVFVALALLLVRAPSLLRSAEFLRELDDWAGAEAVRARGGVALRGRSLAASVAAADATLETPVGPTPEHEVVPDKAAGANRVPGTAGITKLVEFSPAGVFVSVPPNTTVSEAARQDEHAVPGAPETAACLAQPPQSQCQRPAAPRLQTDTRAFEEIGTAFGGVFYLINVAIALEFYSDFTRPLTPGLALPIWDFLALMGRDVGGERIEADPSWALLARLAGRADDEPPGYGFEPPEDEPFPEWLARTAALTRAWLRAALKEPVDICAASALIRVSDSHLDVYYKLAELPLPVRLCGIDRDPGWVPAAGRYVAFHFE